MDLCQGYNKMINRPATKKKMYQISLNTGPTPNFHQNKPANISTSYKETSEKIKYTTKDKTKNNLENKKLNPKFDKNLLRHTDDYINNNKIINEMENNNFNVMKRNMTNYNLNNTNMTNNNMTNNTNVTNSFQTGKYISTTNNNNSSYFPYSNKNAMITSNLNDSNSMNKIHSTFTQRNYNDSHSIIITGNNNYTNNSIQVPLNYLQNIKENMNNVNQIKNGNYLAKSNTYSNLQKGQNNYINSNKISGVKISKINNNNINNINNVNSARNNNLISNNQKDTNNSNNLNTKVKYTTLDKRLKIMNFKNFKNSNSITSTIPLLSPTNNIQNNLTTDNINKSNPNGEIKELSENLIDNYTNINNDKNRLKKIRSGSTLYNNPFNINNIISNPKKLRKDSASIIINNQSRRNNSINNNSNKMSSLKSVENFHQNLPNKIISRNSNNVTSDNLNNNSNNKLNIKSQKSLSILGIKEKYKELLKNKSIPVSMMIKNFKISSDLTSTRETRGTNNKKENVEDDDNNINLNNKINLKNVKVIKKQISTNNVNLINNNPIPPFKQKLIQNNKNNQIPNLKALIEDNVSKSREINQINKNKIISMDLIHNMNGLNSNILVNNDYKKNSPQLESEEEPETIIKNNEKAPEENDFDDINSIIKHLNFNSINVNKENIFSRNNFLYNNFEHKFNEEFDNKLLPSFLERYFKFLFYFILF